MIHRYAGITSVKLLSENFIFVIDVNIKNPTMISAGAVANDGIAVNTGAKNIAIRNKSPVTKVVRPVRPPAKMPKHLLMTLRML